MKVARHGNWHGKPEVFRCRRHLLANVAGKVGRIDVPLIVHRALCVDTELLSLRLLVKVSFQLSPKNVSEVSLYAQE